MYGLSVHLWPWMTFKDQIKVIFCVFHHILKNLCNFFYILAWSFPMRILMNCEEIDVIELL